MTFPRPELLLHPLIPPPLHGLTPRTLLGQAWWDQQRAQAAARNLYRCWACNIPRQKARRFQRLEGHESYAIDWEKGTCRLQEVVSLCHFCHNFIHQGRLAALLAAGRVDEGFVRDVLRHGRNLTAHLPPPPPPPPLWAPWPEWVLLIAGRPYPSRFEDAEEWGQYYAWLNRERGADDDTQLARFRAQLERALQPQEEPCPPVK